MKSPNLIFFMTFSIKPARILPMKVVEEKAIDALRRAPNNVNN
jgi:hypothetical protein